MDAMNETSEVVRTPTWPMNEPMDAIHGASSPSFEPMVDTHEVDAAILLNHGFVHEALDPMNDMGVSQS